MSVLCCILLSVLKTQPLLCMLSKYCASCNVGKNVRHGKIKYLFILLQKTVILTLSDFCCLSYLLHTIKVHLLTGLSDYVDQLFILEYKMYKLLNNRASIMSLNIHV